MTKLLVGDHGLWAMARKLKGNPQALQKNDAMSRMEYLFSAAHLLTRMHWDHVKSSSKNSRLPDATKRKVLVRESLQLTLVQDYMKSIIEISKKAVIKMYLINIL